MEKILVRFHEELFNEEINKVKRTLEQLKYFFSAFSESFDLNITASIANDILYSSDALITAQIISDKVKTDLDQAGIKIEAIHTSATNDALKNFYELFNDFKNKRERHSGCLSSLEVVDNELVIKSTVESEMRERYSYYVTTEAGKEMWELHTQATEFINKLLNMIPKQYRSLSSVFSYQPYLSEKAIASPLDYERLASELSKVD